MRLGIIGDGVAARAHARSFSRIGVRPRIVFGPDSRRSAAFAVEEGIAQAVTSLDALLDSDLDAVVIASPSPVHAEQVEHALQAGKHVLCEIPSATSFLAARLATDQAAQAGRVLMPAHTVRFMPAITRLREQLAESGDRVAHVIATYALFRPTDLALDGTPRGWTDDIVWHHGLHAVDTALLLLDSPVTSICAVGRRAPGDTRFLDVSISLGTAAGSLATVGLSYQSRIGYAEFVVIGRERTWQVRNWQLTSDRDADATADGGPSQAERAMDLQSQAFLDRVAGITGAGFAMADVLPGMQVLADVQQQLVTDREASM